MSYFSFLVIWFLLNIVDKSAVTAYYCNSKVKKSYDFAFEITAKKPSHTYDPELDITTFYYQASRDLKPSEYFFLSDDNCDYLASGRSLDYPKHNIYIDETFCTWGRKIQPVKGSKRDFETYVRGQYPVGNYSMAYSVTEKQYSRSEVRGPNCWCKNGEGVLCEPIEKGISCYRKYSEESEKCNQTWGNFTIDGVFNPYPLTGCRTNFGPAEEWKAIDYSCGYAHRCPTYGVNTSQYGYFSYCCRTNECNYKVDKPKGVDETIIEYLFRKIFNVTF